MGVIYRMSCERCGTTFEHQAGVALYCTCRDCGELGDENSPFFCPVCSKRYDPSDDNFNDRVVDKEFWD